MKKAVILLILLVSLVGCNANRGRLGSYVYKSTGLNLNGQSVPHNYAIDLKSHDECVVADLGPYPVTLGGTYTLEGDKLALKVTVRGTSVVANAHFEGSTMVLDDNTLFDAQMRLTNTNDAGHSAGTPAF